MHLTTPHVQLIVDHDTSAPPSLRTALSRMNARVSIRSLDKALTIGVSPSADVCVVLPSAERSSDVLDRFLVETSTRACGALVIPPDRADTVTNISPDDSAVLTGWAGIGHAAPAGSPLADRRLAPAWQTQQDALNADELTGRIRALCDIRQPLRQMHDELVLLRQHRVQNSGLRSDFDEQIRLASQIQNDLLPDPILDIAPLSVSTLYLPADFVSGDTYDICRLDEDNLSFSLADATGHGLPAALLTILVKNSLHGREIVNGLSQIVEPDEVLTRLNRELLGTRLRQCQFVAALHAVFDRSTHEMRWARGGAPYPILLRTDEPPRQIRSTGSVVGALDNQTYEVIRHTMQPGDLILFYTDGLEALLVDRKHDGGDDAILRTPWLEQLASEGSEDALAEVRILAARRPPNDWPRDDITALAIRMN